MEVIEKPKPFNYCPASVALIKHLATIEHFDIIPYGELQRISGRDCRAGKDGYGPLGTAIKRMLDDGKVFRVIASKGVKRLTPEEAMVVPSEYRHKAGRISKRGIRLGQAIPIDALSEDDRREHYANLAQLGGIVMFSTATSHKKILAATNGHPREIDPARLLDVFR